MLKDVDFKGKTVLVRVDYNVPLSENGEILEDFRIRASLDTLNFLREGGAGKIVLISHLGRPEGRDDSLSLGVVAKALGKMIERVRFVPEVSGGAVSSAVAEMKDGDILLLENLRFWPGEEENSAEFIRGIIESVGAEIYVQDGFAVVHRAHASTVAVAEFLPVYAGFLVEREITGLNKVLNNPARPLVMIVGGAKVDDKAPLIEKFTGFADKVLVGGKIAADGLNLDDIKTSVADKIFIADDFDADETGAKLDIGPVSTAKFVEEIKNAKTVIWNGLLGKAEDPAYATSSTIVAEVLGETDDLVSIICGGDTTGFVENLKNSHKNLNYSLISTGGGAALEYLVDPNLPGLKAIQE